MSAIATIEDLAKTIGTDIETFADSEYHAFLTATAPLYADLQNFVKTTGKTDLATLLADLKQDLGTAVTTLIASGGNVSAAIASVATATVSQVAGVITGDAKNALYGALAIVAADIPAITGTAPVTVDPEAAPEAPVADAAPESSPAA